MFPVVCDKKKSDEVCVRISTDRLFKFSDQMSHTCTPICTHILMCALGQPRTEVMMKGSDVF